MTVIRFPKKNLPLEVSNSVFHSRYTLPKTGFPRSHKVNFSNTQNTHCAGNFQCFFQGAPKIAYKFAYKNSDILNKTATTMASKEEVENLDKKLKACVKYMILNPNSLIPQAMRAIFFTVEESQNPKYQMKV